MSNYTESVSGMNFDPVFYPNVLKIVVDSNILYLLERTIKVTTINISERFK